MTPRGKFCLLSAVVSLLTLSSGQNNGTLLSSIEKELSLNYPSSSTIFLESSRPLLLPSDSQESKKPFRPNDFTTQQRVSASKENNYFSQSTNKTILINSAKDISPSIEPAWFPAASVAPTAHSYLRNDNIFKKNYFSTPRVKLSPTSILTTSNGLEKVLDSTKNRLLSLDDITPVSDTATVMPEENTFSYSHFHTPLMSLLIDPTTISSLEGLRPYPTIFHSQSISSNSLNTLTFNNEVRSTNSSSVPVDPEHKKLLMIVLRAEDCSRFSKADFEKILEKLMVKFGFGDVVPEISNAKCYAHLNINVTVGAGAPTLRFLPNIDGKNNITVDILNRTFRVVKLEKVDLKLEKTKSSNSSSAIINAVPYAEAVAYTCVGVMFGLFLCILIIIFWMKICFPMDGAKKRFGLPKSNHVRLRPEDYTLTPIPRPTSLYVDYYRGSAAADIYSTTSAGSVASTTPTVEQGVIHPFDTSIVPLEDSSALPLDNARDLSVPAKSDLKTFNIQSLSGKGLRSLATDSKEQLHSKRNVKRSDLKTSGVANPTFQRY